MQEYLTAALRFVNTVPILLDNFVYHSIKTPKSQTVRIFGLLTLLSIFYCVGFDASGFGRGDSNGGCNFDAILIRYSFLLKSRHGE
jgi:hypothetical protein